MSTLTEENARLRRELSHVRSINRNLNRLLNPVHQFPKEWGLTPGEGRVLAVLTAAGKMSVDGISRVRSTHVDGSERSTKSAHVAIHTIRKKTGAVIHSVYGDGYYLDNAWRIRLTEYVHTNLEPVGDPNSTRYRDHVPPELVSDYLTLTIKGKYSSEEAMKKLGLR